MSLLRFVRESPTRAIIVAAATLCLGTAGADLLWYEVAGSLPLSKPVHFAAMVLGAAALLLCFIDWRLTTLDRRIDAIHDEVEDQGVRADLDVLLRLIKD